MSQLFGGSSPSLEKTLPKRIYLPLLAFAVEILLSRGGFPEWFVFTLEYGLLFWFVLINLKGRGTWPYWIGGGTLLNFAVIAANGFRMPVWPSFFENSGNSHIMEALISGDIFGYTPVGSGTKLPFLADIIGFSVYGDIIGFASIGDLFLVAGAGILIYHIIKDYRRETT